jgi:hypothetical protein
MSSNLREERSDWLLDGGLKNTRAAVRQTLAAAPAGSGAAARPATAPASRGGESKVLHLARPVRDFH